MRLRRNNAVIAAGLALAMLLAGTAAQGQFWTKKAYGEWSKQDCGKMLNDSPWAQSRTLGRVFIQKMYEDAAVPGRDQTPQITYTVRLLSAPPVRQAMVRLAQLNAEYARLTPEQKADLDARHKQLVEEAFADRIVVQVVYSTTALAYRSELATRWQAQAEEVLKQEINLITERGRVPPARVFVGGGAGGEIQLIFPRTVNGRPVIEVGDKNVSVEFQHPTVGVLSGERIFVEFKVKNMTVGKDVLF
jgi:Spy/CpxP family protein refolding chaperone